MGNFPFNSNIVHIPRAYHKIILCGSRSDYPYQVLFFCSSGKSVSFPDLPENSRKPVPVPVLAALLYIPVAHDGLDDLDVGLVFAEPRTEGMS